MSLASGHELETKTFPLGRLLVNVLQGPVNDPSVPSVVLRTKARVGASAFVKLMNETYTLPVVPVGCTAVSSTATHGRSSIAPTFCPQPSGSDTNVSPRSVDTFIVSQAGPGRSTKNTLWVFSPTAMWLSPPPPELVSVSPTTGMCRGTLN